MSGQVCEHSNYVGAACNIVPNSMLTAALDALHDDAGTRALAVIEAARAAEKAFREDAPELAPFYALSAALRALDGDA